MFDTVWVVLSLLFNNALVFHTLQTFADRCRHVTAIHSIPAGLMHTSVRTEAPTVRKWTQKSAVFISATKRKLQGCNHFFFLFSSKEERPEEIAAHTQPLLPSPSIFPLPPCYSGLSVQSSGLWRNSRYLNLHTVSILFNRLESL